MSKFKVGDRVRVLRNVTGVSTKDTYVGNVYEIANIQCDNGRWGTAYGIREKFVIWDSEIEPATPNTKILITTDGTTTLARLYEGNKVVKSAEAKCAPSDKFDFTTGANLAYDRLMGKAKVEPKPAEKPQDKPAEPVKEPVKLYCVNSFNAGIGLTKGKIYEISRDCMFTYDSGKKSVFDCSRGVPMEWKRELVPLVKRPAKVGEKLVVTESDGHPCNKYKNGDILRAISRVKNGVAYTEIGNIIRDTEYLVLDGYKGENQ